jgi:hypothetical protein
VPALSVLPIVAALDHAEVELDEVIAAPGSSLVSVPVRLSLVEALSEVPDPRKARGVRHGVLAVLLLGACAVLTGARSFAAVAEYAHDAGHMVLSRLGVGAVVPHESTIRRVLQAVDASALEAALRSWALAELAARSPEQGTPARGQRQVLALDGKTMRGAHVCDITDDGEGIVYQPHLVSVLDQATGAVLAQVQVDVKGSEIAAFTTVLDELDLREVLITADALHTHRGHARYLRERGGHYLMPVKANQCATRRSVTSPLEAGQTRREVCWVRWLTWIRKVKGTGACQETDDRAQVPETGCRGTRVVWRRLDCLNPNLQRQQFTATGMAPETGACRGRGVLVRPGHPSRRERCPARAFKEMSGAPGPHFTCDRDERGITVPVRLAVTECS